MKTHIGFMVVGVVGLMLAAPPAECRKFDKRQSFPSAERVRLDYQEDIARQIAESQAFGEARPADRAAAATTPNKAGQRAFDLCLSRCAGPINEMAPRRAGLAPGGDLNDAALMERLRKIGVGLSWKAAPNVGISADYEKVMDAVDVGRVAPDTVRARMQWDF